jgi:peptidoglycan DL-endopeptidase CwlO
VTPIRIRQLTSQALGEATFVSSRHNAARHRAGAALLSPLKSMSRAALAGARNGSHSADSISAESGLQASHLRAATAFGASSQYTLR